MKQWEKNLQYTCSRCREVVSEEEDVLILMPYGKKDPIDLCSKCTKEFKKFINGAEVVELTMYNI